MIEECGLQVPDDLGEGRDSGRDERGSGESGGGGGDDDAAHCGSPLRVRLTPLRLLGMGGTYETPSYQPLTR